VPSERRTARFRCVVVVQWPDGREVDAEGVVEGRISSERRGGTGFGYDPVFIPDEGDGRTFGEMTPDEKHALSHRGRALRALATALAHLPDEHLGSGVAGDQTR
jgi:XTP/dITP diphosphohydrolase